VRQRLVPIVRGAVGRCAHCGARGVFASYFTLHDRCPTCGYLFEREEGYWLGAMIANIGVTEALFGLFFVAGMLLTWPDVPWTGLLIGGLVINATVPVVYYPLSKTQWVGLHLAFVRPDPAEEAVAIAARAASEARAAELRRGAEGR
jgi:uncharacterized protein (DUF983 family)